MLEVMKPHVVQIMAWCWPIAVTPGFRIGLFCINTGRNRASTAIVFYVSTSPTSSSCRRNARKCRECTLQAGRRGAGQQ